MLFSTHVEKIPHIFLTLKFIAKNDLLYFLTSSDVRKGFPHISPAHLQFPHILHVWNWLQQISSHFSTQSSQLENQTKIPHIFPMCGILANALFLTSIPHMRKIPHFFLTFSSHWNFIGMQILTFSTVRKSNTYITYTLPKKKQKKILTITQNNLL